MRILAVAAPLPGHFDWGGYLVTTRALQDEGHHVLWASEAPALSLPRHANLPTVPLSTTGWQSQLPPLPANLTPVERARRRQQRALDVWLDEKSVLAGVAALGDVSAQFRPDLILTEPYVVAATILAEKQGLPLVVCGVPAETIGGQPTPLGETAWARFRYLTKQLRIEGSYWSHGALPWPQSPYLHVSYFNREWYGQQDIGKQTFFAGGRATAPTGMPTWLQAIPRHRRIVLITLGSTFNQDIVFFQNSAAAVRQVGAVPVIAAGRGWPEKQWQRLAAALPQDTILLPWVDFDALFPRLWAVIHHGGVATTHQAIINALPQIIVPHAGDQHRQATRVQANGIGFAMAASHATKANLAALLDRLLFQKQFQARAQQLQAAFSHLGGPKAAAIAIVQTVAP